MRYRHRPRVLHTPLNFAHTVRDSSAATLLRPRWRQRKVVEVTAGYLRAGLRKVDEAPSKPGSPVLSCRIFEAVPIGQTVRYRIPLVPSARRFKAGHKVRLYLTTDDEGEHNPSLLLLSQASIVTTSLSTIR